MTDTARPFAIEVRSDGQSVRYEGPTAEDVVRLARLADPPRVASAAAPVSVPPTPTPTPAPAEPSPGKAGGRPAPSFANPGDRRLVIALLVRDRGPMRVKEIAAAIGAASPQNVGRYLDHPWFGRTDPANRLSAYTLTEAGQAAAATVPPSSSSSSPTTTG